jgi:hypothetical protein
MSNPFFSGYKNKLSGNLYGLLCERENRGQWEEYLNAIQIELIGFEKELDSINYWKLMGKIGSLKLLNYKYFRKTIFDCIQLLDSLNREDK